MNLTITSDRAVDVDVFMMFTDGCGYTFKMKLNGYQSVQHCVVGRWPQDLVHMELEYNGGRFAHPIEPEGQNLKIINIYGGRDTWSQLLRDAAMESARTGTTPEDYEDLTDDLIGGSKKT